MDEQFKNQLLDKYKTLLKDYTGGNEKYITHIVNQDEINPKFEGLAEVLKEGLYAYETADLQNTENLQIENQNDTNETSNTNDTSNSGTTSSY